MYRSRNRTVMSGSSGLSNQFCDLNGRRFPALVMLSLAPRRDDDARRRMTARQDTGVSRRPRPVNTRTACACARRCPDRVLQGADSFTLTLDVDELARQMGDDHLFLLRLHFLVAGPLVNTPAASCATSPPTRTSATSTSPRTSSSPTTPRPCSTSRS